ncbi:hypothetical protein ACSBR2_007039 [Camellia fascicularis]
MGVGKKKGVVFGDYPSLFDDLRWYVDAANDCNLGSVFYMEFDVASKGRHFKCLFFSFEVCIHGFRYCRPVLKLDGIFLKRRHKGCLLAAMTKDGNQDLYPLCFAIVNSESYDNWHWFLSKLFVILTLGRDIAFVTNRHEGLLKALAEVFPFSSHSFCLMHLKTNLKTYLSVKSSESKEYFLTLFSRCAYAHTIELFNKLFEEFKGCCGRSVQKFLEDLPNECWCNPILKAREKKLEKAFNDTKAWIVKKCSDDIYEIQLDHSVMVDIGKLLRLWKPNVVIDDDAALPPLCKRPAGHPRTERIPSKGEIKRVR